MKPEVRRKLDELYGHTDQRLHLEEWEQITHMLVSADTIMVAIETYEVKVLVREDRYLRKGTRVVIYKRAGSRWFQESDNTLWDDDFEPYVFEKIGRRKTDAELIEQREWEKMCFRPGNARTQLDSYERVLDPFVRSTDKMERHF